jgi:predicted Fe-Mo cluster-binding NifX family protein
MKIAVTYDPATGLIGQHFGQSEYIKLYNVDDKQIIGDVVLPTDGQGHGAVAGFLSSLNVDMLICGGIGGGAKQAVASRGIALLCGVVGGADAAVNAFLNNTLAHNQDFVCPHHAQGQSCSDHDCSQCGHGKDEQ